MPMAPLHSLDQDIQNEVQHGIFGQVTPLAPALASHDADGIVNGTITFLNVQMIKTRCNMTF